ncbi:MAG: type IV pilus twitching motility protein PilT [Actinobacteria bacterium]|nr:type IV pilus twitching motility protein PilT [Actinomycetota bacterium]
MDMNELLEIVVQRGGSDLHITVGVPPMMRLHGDLMPIENTPVLTKRDTQDLIFSVMSDERRTALEEDLETDFAYAIPGHGVRFRVNAYYQRTSLGAAFRLIPLSIRTIAELGLPDVVASLADKTRGFVLITGPTGCGKSTTIAAMIDRINSTRAEHVMTIEDPIEYLHSHKRSVVNQREVNSDTKSFGSALKHVLRQDPDVILIGEMRDLETVAAALTAAETGHLVFATLHTQDASQTVDRIIDVFPPSQQAQIRVQLAGTLQGVVSQQLLPAADGRSRAVACEVLIPTPAIRNLIREGKAHQLMTAMQTGTQYGMVTMDASLADMYKQGIITLDTAMQRAVDPAVLMTLLDKTR